jgi:hypothetical protein
MLLVSSLVFFSCDKDDNYFLSLSGNEFRFQGEGGEFTVTISSNTGWDITIVNSWVTAEKSTENGESSVTVKVSENYSDQDRSTTITVSAGSLMETISVSQESLLYSDGSVISCRTFSTSKAGKPVNLVIMGDGFIRDDYCKGGSFDEAVERAITAFFSLEPFPTYREYFNIYKITAYSEEREATVQRSFQGSSPKKQTRNTVFGSVFEGGTSTGIDCDDSAVFEYALKIPEITESELTNTTIIVIINLEVYAGTTIMYSDGKSIALCPMGDAYEEIVYHEAAGHGFGRLMDEYIYYTKQTYPRSESQELDHFRQGDVWSFGANLSTTGNRDEVHWKHYFEKNGYETVGLYEGGDSYGKGVWRAEENSCMNDNTPYFNAPSREAIVRRIMSVCGTGFDYNTFYANDKYKPAVSTRSLASKVPLASPVLKR